jgi:hypothetical protein
LDNLPSLEFWISTGAVGRTANDFQWLNDATNRLRISQRDARFIRGTVDLSQTRIAINNEMNNPWWQWRVPLYRLNTVHWQWNKVLTPQVRIKEGTKLSVFEKYNDLGQVVNQEITLEEQLVPFPATLTRVWHNIFYDKVQGVVRVDDMTHLQKGSVLLANVGIDRHDTRRRISIFTPAQAIQLLNNQLGNIDKLGRSRIINWLTPDWSKLLSTGTVLPIRAPETGWFIFRVSASSEFWITINDTNVYRTMAHHWTTPMLVQKGDYIGSGIAVLESRFIPCKGVTNDSFI